MARFDLSRFKGGHVVDVQANHLTEFQIRVVAPLLRDGDVPAPMPRTHPVFTLAGQPYVMVTHLLSALAVGGATLAARQTAALLV